jgi:Ca2+-transporting ATPase
MLLYARHCALVETRQRWASIRVRGLLRNATLGQFLEAGAPSALTLRVATGTIRVTVSTDFDATAWLSHVDARVEAWLTDRRAYDARAKAPASSPPVPTARPAVSLTARPHPVRPAGQPERAVAAEGDPDGAPHAEALSTLLARLGEDMPIDPARGLTAAGAAARRTRDGPNEIRDVTGRTAAQILAGQFDSVPVGLLGASGALALATRAFADAGAIGAVLAANATLGFVTERRAEQTVSSLRRLAPHRATVLRDGDAVVIDARDVVVGDVLVLEPGEPVAADARVIDAHRLATNEAALTGESLPVRKSPAEPLPADTPLGERRNMVFLGTVVSGGTGRAVVVATAERAALGRIRRLAQTAQAPRTQLQEQLDALGRRLAVGAAVLCVGTFGIGLLRGRPLLPLLRTAVSLGVAAIPEGLPTVATSLLASGIRSLQERQVYARRLDAIENLGAIDTVCFDKTGTLTRNRMSVASLTVGSKPVMLDNDQPAPTLPDAWLRVAALCNALERSDPTPDGAPQPVWNGSSTELALLEFAASQGLDVQAVRSRLPPLSVRHRSEHHPYMVTVHRHEESGLWIAVKGRPDAVLARCEAWFDGDGVRPLGEAERTALLALNDWLAERGHRVLGLAHREQDGGEYGETAGLTWIGLVGLADPLRPDLPDMVRRFDNAGIRTLMITGDQPGTAGAVARAIGLPGEAGVVDASRLPESAAAIVEVAERASAFARTSPGMKLEIVRALQSRGHVVAMTGDGINDGPALRTADVGVAMGVTGTDFAHAMSDLVLQEDHPAAILAAIEQGRTAFVNIRKSVRYLVATNLSELAATTIAVAVGLPEPFEPMQLLWTNLATDVWPAIGLGLEPTEPGLLERPPVSLRDGLLDRSQWSAVAFDAGAMTVASLGSFVYGLVRYGAGPRARTLAFTTLTVSQLLYALSVRTPRPLRAGGLSPNPTLSAGVGVLLLAQAGTILIPSLRTLLRTAPVGPLDVLVIGTSAVMPTLLRELLKERQGWTHR